MRFIFKSVFWFAVVLALLPENSPKTPTDDIDRSITTGTIGSASEIRDLASRLQAVCEKNPELCVSSLDNMSMVAAMLGYQAVSWSICSDNDNR